MCVCVCVCVCVYIVYIYMGILLERAARQKNGRKARTCFFLFISSVYTGKEVCSSIIFKAAQQALEMISGDGRRIYWK